MSAVRFDPRLYLVLDPSTVPAGQVEPVLEAALRGGVTLVQVREKICSNEEFLRLAAKAASVLKKSGVPLIVNDRLDIAVAVGAQGVHLGQSDLPWKEARRVLGPRAIVGVSVESLEQAEELKNAEVNYLGVSSVFATRTKGDLKHVWGLDGLAELRRRCSLPLVGIGGIHAGNGASVLRAGADGLAVVSAICGAPDPEQTSRRLRALIEHEQARGRRQR